MNIAAWLIDTITVSEQSGISGSVPTFGAQSTMSGRVEKKLEIRIGADGNERMSSHRVATLTEIGLNARVWLPGDNTSNDDEARRPINIESAYTKDGSTTLYMTFF